MATVWFPYDSAFLSAVIYTLHPAEERDSVTARQ